MKKSLIVLFLLFFVAISVINFQNNIVTPEEDEYLLHAESSERLLSIMEEISTLASRNSIEEPVKLTEEDMTDLIEASEELLFYAELMSIKVPANVSEENQNVVFSAMASKLYSEVLNIQQITKNYNLQITDHSEQYILDDAFRRLSQTCNACHQLFRDQ